MSRRMTVLLFAVVAAQVIGLVVFATVRQVAVTQGREVTLQTVPVDPRSLLQGDYAILDYEIAELPNNWDGIKIGDTVDVVLRPGPEVWRADYYLLLSKEDGASYIRGPVHAFPRDGDLSGEVFIRGRVNDRRRLDFGIGTFFVPEGTGHIVERAQDVKVVVSLSASGNAVIKTVLVDGEPFDPGMEPAR